MSRTKILVIKIFLPFPFTAEYLSVNIYVALIYDITSFPEIFEHGKLNIFYFIFSLQDAWRRSSRSSATPTSG